MPAEGGTPVRTTPLPRPTPDTPPASSGSEVVEDQVMTPQDEVEGDDACDTHHDEALDQVESEEDAMAEPVDLADLPANLVAAIGEVVAERVEQATAHLAQVLIAHFERVGLHQRQAAAQPVIARPGPVPAVPHRPVVAAAAPIALPAAAPPAHLDQQRLRLMDDMTSKYKPSERESVKRALSVLRVFAPKPPRPAFRAEEEHACRTLYVKGLQWEKTKVVRQALFALHFHRSRIRNLSWLGHYVLEVVVDADYHRRCKEQLLELPGVTVDDAFSPLGGPSPEDQAQAMDRFVHRANKIIATTRVQSVRDFFTAWREEVAPEGRLVGWWGGRVP